MKARLLGFLRRKLFVGTALETPLRWLVKGAKADGLRAKLLPNHDLFPAHSPRTITIADRQISFNLGEWMEWAAYFRLEDPTTAQLLKLLRPADYALDIGTNIGSMLIPMAKKVGPHGKVYGFEPSAGRFMKCTEHLAFENISNAQVAPIALGSGAGFVNMSSPDPRNLGRNKVMSSPNSDGAVRCMTLDQWVLENNLSRIDFIKIDVEGFEADVLEGMGQVLKKFRPTLFIEIDRLNLLEQGHRPAEIMAKLVAENYSLSRADGAALGDELPEHFDLIASPL